MAWRQGAHHENGAVGRVRQPLPGLHSRMKGPQMRPFADSTSACRTAAAPTCSAPGRGWGLRSRTGGWSPGLSYEERAARGGLPAAR